MADVKTPPRAALFRVYHNARGPENAPGDTPVLGGLTYVCTVRGLYNQPSGVYARCLVPWPDRDNTDRTWHSNDDIMLCVDMEARPIRLGDVIVQDNNTVWIMVDVGVRGLGRHFFDPFTPSILP